MASRRFTVDPVKKKEFINIFLLMPESSVINAMRQATFTDENIADLSLRRSLQRALPGGSSKGLKDYIARQRKQPPPHLPVDPAATDAAATVPPPEEIVIDAEATTVLSSLSPGTATKRKYDRKRWNCIYYKKKGGSTGKQDRTNDSASNACAPSWCPRRTIVVSRRCLTPSGLIVVEGMTLQ